MIRKTKKYFGLFAMFFFLTANSFSQVNINVPDTLVIFGVDFSLGKIVTKNNYEIQDIMSTDIPRLNSEMIRICKQYITKFRAKQMVIDTTDVCKINSSIKTDSLISKKHFIFSNGDASVKRVLDNYNTEKYANGTGLLFVMEKVDERIDRESFYILMFDLPTKKIIHCDKVETGLSFVKNKFASGWLSWKTGILKVVSSMDDVYDFWNNYPESKSIDIVAKAPPYIKNNTALSETKREPFKGTGVKKQKLILLSGAFSFVGNDLEDAYRSAFYEAYGTSNIYGVRENFSYPKINLSFEYGFAKRHAMGVSVGYDKGNLEWADTVKATVFYIDSWSRYQASVKYNFYLVATPLFRLYSGILIGYNYYKRSASPIALSVVDVKPSPLCLQLHLGITFLTKRGFAINAGGALGSAGTDFITLGLGYKF